MTSRSDKSRKSPEPDSTATAEEKKPSRYRLARAPAKEPGGAPWQSGLMRPPFNLWECGGRRHINVPARAPSPPPPRPPMPLHRSQRRHFPKQTSASHLDGIFTGRDPDADADAAHH